MRQITLEVATEPIQKRSTKPKYSVELEFMHGDADGFTTETVIFDNLSNDEVKSMKHFLSVCLTVHRKSVSSSSELREYDGWSLYFDEDCDDPAAEDTVYVEWPSDITTLGDHPCQLWKIDVTYINGYGEVFPVTIKTTD